MNPKKVLSKKGSSVSIDCVVSGTTKPAKVTWTFNGEAVENTEERKILANNTLYISVLRSSYKGEYKCEASIDSAPPKSDIVTVDIAGKVVPYVYIMFLYDKQHCIKLCVCILG